MSLTAPLAALRVRNFRLFFVGNVLSTTGTWTEGLAIAWLVYRITGDDELWLGLVSAAPAIPALLLSIPAGALIDRVRMRRVLYATQTLMMLLSLGLAFLVLSGHVEAWHLLVYMALSRGAFVVDAPARQTFVAQVVPRELYSNAIALNATSFNVARFLGAFTFGLMFQVVELREVGCIVLNACSFGCSLLGLVLIGRLDRPRPPARRDGHLLEGLRYALRTPVARAILVLMLFTALFGYQVTHLLPVYAKKVWDAGPDGLKDLNMALGLGALTGGTVLTFASLRLHRGRLINRYTLLSPPLLAAFAFAPALWMGTALIAGIGFLSLQVHASTSALLQSTVPDELRGRVMALFTLCVLASFPIGGLVGGWMAKALGAPATTLVGAMVIMAVALAVRATHPQLRRAA